MIEFETIPRLNVFFKLIEQYLLYNKSQVVRYEWHGVGVVVEMLYTWARSVEFVLEVVIADSIASIMADDQVPLGGCE